MQFSFGSFMLDTETGAISLPVASEPVRTSTVVSRALMTVGANARRDKNMLWDVLVPTYPVCPRDTGEAGDILRCLWRSEYNRYRACSELWRFSEQFDLLPDKPDRPGYQSSRGFYRKRFGS